MIWIGLGSLFMFVAVALGAFGAHALKFSLTSDMLNAFETGVRYQIYHALGLLAVGWLSEAHPQGLIDGAGWAFTIGIIIFSGSLYVLSLSGVRWWGAITPIGGVSFLVGWALIFLFALRQSN